MRSRVERERTYIIEDLLERVNVVRDRNDDRIACIWALKVIAEDVAKLDAADREEGFLPLQIRPALMLSSNETSLALQIIREYVSQKGDEVSSSTQALLEKLRCYFHGRI